MEHFGLLPPKYSVGVMLFACIEIQSNLVLLVLICSQKLHCRENIGIEAHEASFINIPRWRKGG